MKPSSDLLTLKYSQPSDTVVFAICQDQGKRARQEDFFTHYANECFVVADGVGGLAHGDVAAKLAAETAIWGYTHIRLRPMYWNDKRLLVRRIFRSTNLTIWQKQKEPGFTDGMATTLSVAIVGPRTVWVGSAGDSSIYLFREGLMSPLTNSHIDSQGLLTNALGVQRLGLVPECANERFIDGDTLLMATDGLTSFVEEDEVRRIIEKTGRTASDLKQSATALIALAKSNGSTDNITVCLIKRIRTVSEE